MDFNKVIKDAEQIGIKYIERLYYNYRYQEWHTLCTFPNGRIYFYYDIYNTKEFMGPFKDIEEAKLRLDFDKPKSYKVWEKPVEEKLEQKNLNLIYRTQFNLTAPVLNFEKARSYLVEDNMTSYVKSDNMVLCRDKIKCINWKLLTEDSGRIEVVTSDYLTEEESTNLSYWISDQCSDGIGEGFSQQSFAGNAEFDWRVNNYKLELDKHE